MSRIARNAKLHYTKDEFRSCQETIEHLREYLRVMADEPKDNLIPLSKVYHDIRRIIGDE